jgi:hypothetical protein
LRRVHNRLHDGRRFNFYVEDRISVREADSRVFGHQTGVNTAESDF